MSDKLFAMGDGVSLGRLKDMGDGTHAEVVAVSGGAAGGAGGTIVTDSTGTYTFNLGSLACVPTYDAFGNMVTITYGPDAAGRKIRQTSTWNSNIWYGDSAWILV